MSKLTISLVQINIQPNQFDKNSGLVLDMVSSLTGIGSHFVLLPELWSTGFTPELEKNVTKNNRLIEQLSKIASRQNIFLCGSFIQKNIHHKFVNQFIVIDPLKGARTRYNKIHLFSQMNEVDWFEPGTQPVMLNYGDIKIGLSVCYDLRFPELFRLYSRHGVNLSLLPAQWPSKRIDHFVSLAKARAIENQMFFAISNAVGMIGSTEFGGESAVFSPNGDRLISLGKQENIIQSIEIDLQEAAAWRNDFPAMADVREDVYQNPILSISI